MNKSNNKIKNNIKAHERVLHKYEETHGEIYNEIEQSRLRNVLEFVKNEIKTSSNEIQALDYGSGSGNLTKHLIDLKIATTSADISEKLLSFIKRKFEHTGLSTTLRIDGESLSEIKDASYDLVSIYSVLHHIPDYIFTLKEILRVIKKGGILFIDHEASESYWQKNKTYLEFLEETKKEIPLTRKLLNLAYPEWYIRKIRLFLNPRYQEEGDIHVWPDDHIEWNKIEEVLISNNFEIVKKQPYLLFRSTYDPSVYSRYEKNCDDMQYLIARKGN